MIEASQAWIAAHEQNILPETFVEISYGIVDEEAQRLILVSAGDEERFSNADNVAVSTAPPQYYATTERNLWFLNGTRNIFDPSAGRQNIGYVSEGGRNGSVQLSFPRVMDALIPGITITWSSEYNEYPETFTVTARNGSNIIATKTVTGNTDVTSVVDLELSGYNSIMIEFSDWCVPNRRCRMDGVAMGIGVTFTKQDLTSFIHESEGDMSSGSISKSSIKFSLDNSTGVWNPDNPQGIVKYLAERQQLVVRYGMRVNNDIEWVEAGTFYLSEWDTPSGGMEASFVARDAFEYLLNTPYPSGVTGNLNTLVERAFVEADMPDEFVYYFAGGVTNYSATPGENHTAAEVIQMCANAAGCGIRQDRLGRLHITPTPRERSGYTISKRVSLSHPEVILSKPLKSVVVSYRDNSYTLNVSNSGETQTIDNPLITTEYAARVAAEVARDALVTRKSVKGEFRADPRLDLFDIVTVESKYGDLFPVMITAITYTYNGSFWATYSGRVLDPGVMED